MIGPTFNTDLYLFLQETTYPDRWTVYVIEGPEITPLYNGSFKQASALATKEASVEGLDIIVAGYCPHCDSNINRMSDYYMVQDSVWDAAQVPGSAELHLRCLAERIGRPLTIDDFTPARANAILHFGYALGRAPRTKVATLVAEWLTEVTSRWERGCIEPPENPHLMDDMPDLPGNVSIGEFIDEVRRCTP